MIRWINRYIGTGPYGSVNSGEDPEVVDVRDLVDKPGNNIDRINDKIKKGVHALKSGRKVVICCDYGISRSNAIAAGIIAQYEAVSFDQAVKMVLQSTGEKSIKIEVLNAVRKAVGTDKQNTTYPGTILLTGGTGFVGRRFKDTLAKPLTLLAPDSTTLNLLTDTVELDRIVKHNSIGTLVHLANPRIYSSNYALGETLVMLKNILDVCRENSVKLVYSSCWEVYSGYGASRLLADENLARQPKGAAGEAKHFSEQLIELYAQTHGIEAVILRISPIYGAGSDKPRFLHNFIDKALSNTPIVTHRYRNGAPLLDLVHVDDVTAALEKAAQTKLSGCINIGSGTGYSTYDIAHMIKRMTGSSSPIDTLEIDSSFSNIVMDTQKAKSILSWSVSMEFEKWLHSRIEGLMKERTGYE